MRQTPTTSIHDVRPGTVLLIGTGFHYVQNVFPAVSRIRYRLWDEAAKAWRTPDDLTFPVAHLDAYEIPEASRLLPAPQ